MSKFSFTCIIFNSLFENHLIIIIEELGESDTAKICFVVLALVMDECLNDTERGDDLATSIIA